MQARYYDPIVGRFLSVDPVTFIGSGYDPAYVNRYAYAGNNPASNIDPDGQFFGAAGKLIKLAIKGGDVGATLAGAVSDFKTLTDSNASVGERVLAAGSLVTEVVSPVSARDAKAGLDTVQSLRKTCCFVAGTLVDTENGLQAIEEIRIGDRVWARDVSTGKTELKTVTDLIRRHERAIWVVTLSGADGESAQFETTDDHPWWIAGEGWTDTEALKPGMAVVTIDGRGMVIDSVEPNVRTDATYNLTVADFQTYFVGERRVLVHNCPNNSPDVVTANGQKASADGTPLGGSGKAHFHNSNSATRKKAIDGAKNDPRGSGQIVTDKANSKQSQHHHAVKSNGERVSGPGKTHYNVRGEKPRRSDDG